MNILYILPEKPTTMAFGALQRTNLLWDALRGLGDVYAVFFDTNPQTRFVDERLVAIGTMPKVGGRQNFFYRIQNRLPHDLCLLEFGPLKPWTASSIKDSFPDVAFDIVVCRYINNFALYHIWDMHLPTIVDIDDHPLQLFDTFIGNKVTPYLRPLARKALKWQMRYLESKVQGVWVSNASNKDFFLDSAKVRCLMNIPVPAKSTYVRAAMPKPYLLTVGAMNYYPNHHGVAQFLADVWQNFHAKHPEVEYYIAGKDAPSELIEQCNGTPGVKYLGYVPDLDDIYANCTATVVPVSEGSGTCIKTLESISRHVPCITTTFGARGLEYGCDDLRSIALFLYGDTKDFTFVYEEVIRTLTDSSVRDRMDDYIAANYSREHFNAIVRDLVESITKHI